MNREELVHATITDLQKRTKSLERAVGRLQRMETAVVSDEHLIEDAVTDDISTAITWTHNTTGTADDGFGVEAAAKAETSTTASMPIGAIAWIWRVATHLVRRSALALFAQYGDYKIQVANLEAPDYEPTAPDARGEGSVDFQSGRYSSGDRVASGYAAVLGGGEDNKASGTYATVSGGSQNLATANRTTIGGGEDNVASDNRATVGGGGNNEASGGSATIAGGFNGVASGDGAAVAGGGNNEAAGDYAAIGGGIGNVATGSRAATPGGASNILEGDYSSACGGVLGRATLFGQHVHSVGWWGDEGDQQFSRLVFANETNNATPTNLFLDANTTARLVLRDNEVWSFHGRVVARRTNTTKEHAEYTIEGLIHRNGGVATTTLDRQVVTTLFEDDATWTVALSADTTNGALQIQVTGAASKTIQWVGFIEIVSTLG